MTALIDLDREECIRLLRTQAVGRIAMAVPGDAPLVVPVNYAVDGDHVVFRSNPGDKVAFVGAGPVSFQVDFIDWYHRTGWSVLGRGRAYEASEWEIGHLLLEPWVGGDLRHWIRVQLADVTGRRIERIDLDFPNDDRGYL